MEPRKLKTLESDFITATYDPWAHVLEDGVTQDVKVEFPDGSVQGFKGVLKYKSVEPVPLTFWQRLRQHLFPAWLLKRWPVEQEWEVTYAIEVVEPPDAA